MSERYNPFTIEPTWQKAWAEKNVFKTEENSKKPKYYVLEMFPYPSGELHVGHARNYTVGDVIARFRRAQGYNVLHPMGWDAFGMPAENAAIKHKVHPKQWTEKNIARMKDDLALFGVSIDWARELATCDPAYYKHQQAFFIDLYNKGLVYAKEAQVNWDPVDQTVLANEQVVDGRGWRSGAAVERRTMKQWFFKITAYADELLEGIKALEDWPEQVKTMQTNWIGFSQGLTFTFNVPNWAEGLTVYTTRPDTLMGSTFCSIAPEHPLATHVAESDPEAALFIKECASIGTSEEAIEKAEKRGHKTPFSAIHPITGEALPIYIANFVLMSYGTGAIMAVPAHDERDHAFATKYGLPIRPVISGGAGEQTPYTGAGMLINSGVFTGLASEEAKEKIITHFETQGTGKRTTNYRLRDWGVSRQRYWGTPIPFVNCASCGTVPVNKADLPIELPMDVQITGEGGNPLAKHPTWKHTPCPSCGNPAERETDTMDTFVDSSWYFARYTSVNNTQNPITKASADYWLPVDQYIGGIEHAVLHLLYARFVTRALKSLGYVNVEEPFKALLTQGMVLSPYYQAQNGEYINPLQVRLEKGKAYNKETSEELKVFPNQKMSKSKNNGVAPRPMVETYGADTLRMYMMFCSPIERTLEWQEAGVEGAWRYLGRLWGLVHDAGFKIRVSEYLQTKQLVEKEHKDLKRKIHKTVEKVTSDLEKQQFNTMIAACMELSNTLSDYKNATCPKIQALYTEGVLTLLQLLNPVAPHITEQLWQNCGNKQWLIYTPWPVVDQAALTNEEVTMVLQVNGKLRERLVVAANISPKEAEEKALQTLQKYLTGTQIVKCVVVPNRLVNVVVKNT